VPHLAASGRPVAVRAPASPAPVYARHTPERTLLYALVQAHYPDFLERQAAHDHPVPDYVRAEFDAYLRCGVLDHGFLRVVCEQCHAERLVAFSCKKRGLCPSCGARRMAGVGETPGRRRVRPASGAAVGAELPVPAALPVRQQTRGLGPVLGIVQRVIAGWLADRAGVPRNVARNAAR
jgi:ribosomal protein S27E